MTNVAHGADLFADLHSATTPKPINSDRLAALAAIKTNIPLHTTLFDDHGRATPLCIELLSTLPLRNSGGKHVVDALGQQDLLTHPHLEDVLQAAFFKPNQALFSFEVAKQGESPDTNAQRVFARIDMLRKLTVDSSQKYDTAVVLGGLLGAMDSRIGNLLHQYAEFKSIALLGSKRPLIQDKEGPQQLQLTLGEDYFAELKQTESLPKTEGQLLLCLWERYCRQYQSFRNIPIIGISSELREGPKTSPGTPETVSDLARELLFSRLPGLSASPTTFLVSSSQPFAPRQLQDFIANMILSGYPVGQADVIGYEAQTMPTLTLLGNELAKLVHAQFIARY